MSRCLPCSRLNRLNGSGLWQLPLVCGWFNRCYGNSLENQQMVQPLPVPHVGSRLDHRDSSSPDRLRHLFSRCGQPTCRTIIGQSRIRERHDSGECHPMADRPSTQLRSNPRPSSAHCSSSSASHSPSSTGSEEEPKSAAPTNPAKYGKKAGAKPRRKNNTMTTGSQQNTDHAPCQWSAGRLRPRIRRRNHPRPNP